MKKWVWAGVVLGAIGLCGCGRAVVVTPAGAIQDNFFATWEIESIHFGPLDCEQAGAATVDMDIVNVDTGSRVIDTFPCNDYQGTSDLFDIGHFDVLLNLNDPTGAVLSQAEIGAENVTVAGTIDLGHVIFQIP